MPGKSPFDGYLAGDVGGTSHGRFLPKQRNGANYSRSRFKESSVSSHGDSQFHLVVYGHNTGACMCLKPCCYDPEMGCVCKHCSGAGHSNCVELNIKRAKARVARERYKARVSNASVSDDNNSNANNDVDKAMPQSVDGD